MNHVVAAEGRRGSRVGLAIGIVVIATLLVATAVVSWRAGPSGRRLSAGARSQLAAGCQKRVIPARDYFVPRNDRACQGSWVVTSGDLTTPLPDDPKGAGAPSCDAYVDAHALRHQLCAYSGDGSTFTRFQFRDVPQACVPSKGAIPASLLRRPVLISDCELAGRSVHYAGVGDLRISRRNGGECEGSGSSTGHSAELCVNRNRYAVWATYSRS